LTFVGRSIRLSCRVSTTHRLRRREIAFLFGQFVENVGLEKPESFPSFFSFSE
jgi:hypothetical protein